jgi:DNA primase
MTPLVDLVRPYLKKLKKSGTSDIMAICPFHRKRDGSEERNGSFAMNIYNGLWYCHSCHETGNIGSFLSRVGMSDFLIKQYDDVIQAAAHSMPAPRSNMMPIAPTELILEESFLGVFDTIPENILKDPAFLGDFTPEIIRHFDIGFDSTHQRITFPLRDMEGQLVGISGRSLGGGAKYKVYDREYETWGLPSRPTEKRALLWNAHAVEQRLVLSTDPGDKYLVLVEGFKACMKLVQAGVENTVALLGSYLADEQCWWVQRMDVPVLIMLDNNEAGFSGALYAGKQLPSGTHSVSIVTYDKPQPSDLSPAEIIQALLQASPFDTWFVQLMMNHSDLSRI